MFLRWWPRHRARYHRRGYTPPGLSHFKVHPLMIDHSEQVVWLLVGSIMPRTGAGIRRVGVKTAHQRVCPRKAPAGAAFGRPGAGRRAARAGKGPTHTRHRARCRQARRSSYLTCRPSSTFEGRREDVYRSPASKRTAPRTSSQIRCSRVVTVM